MCGECHGVALVGYSACCAGGACALLVFIATNKTILDAKMSVRDGQRGGFSEACEQLVSCGVTSAAGKTSGAEKVALPFFALIDAASLARRVAAVATGSFTAV